MYNSNNISTRGSICVFTNISLIINTDIDINTSIKANISNWFIIIMILITYNNYI